VRRRRSGHGHGPRAPQLSRVAAARRSVDQGQPWHGHSPGSAEGEDDAEGAEDGGGATHGGGVAGSDDVVDDDRELVGEHRIREPRDGRAQPQLGVGAEVGDALDGEVRGVGAGRRRRTLRRQPPARRRPPAQSADQVAGVAGDRRQLGVGNATDPIRGSGWGPVVAVRPDAYSLK
jgi:hypothetical protein